MKKLITLFVAAGLSAIVVNNTQAQYQIDDGVSEIALGHGNFGDLVFGTYFDAIAGQETIVNVAVAIGDGGILMGDSMTVLLYDDSDDDGDPSTGLVFISNTAAVVDVPEPVGTDTFQIVDIPDAMISGGFFVAVFMEGTNNPFPGKMDQSSTQARAWFAENDTIGVLDVMDPFGTSTLNGLADDFGFPGNWLLRANVDDGNCTPGDVNMDGQVDLLDVAPFVAELTAGSTLCEADVNQDGVVDLLDVAPFVDLLAGG